MKNHQINNGLEQHRDQIDKDKMSGISILIMTLNEEVNLPDCLASCSWSNDIVVFDSFSTDRTIELATANGARVIQRKFDNYANQRNAALHNVTYKNDWVMMLDADERIPPELAQEMKRTISVASKEISIFRLRRKDIFFGRWLRRSSGYPTWSSRLVQPKKVTVERDINELIITTGEIGSLDNHFIHHPFNKGIAWWYERHNRYSTMEAAAILSERRTSIDWKLAFSREPSSRRQTLKQIAYRIPCRPLLVFIYLYFFRLGFIDGAPGFYYSLMRASYELMIDLKIKELKERA